MDKILMMLKEIAEHFDLRPGDKFTVTINHVGNPSVEYSRKITREGVESGRYDRPTPWRKWQGLPEDNRNEKGD